MRIILGAACVAALISSTTGVSATTDLPGFLPELSAGTIAVISDGEFVAQTYAMGRLAPAGAGLRDRLTILTIEDGTVRTASLNVSNSVTAAPEVIALTPDGATAFVVERLGERPAGGETVRDLSPGNRLFAVDLSDKANPVIADTIEIAPFPEALSVGPQGDRVAVVSNTPDASYLQIAALADGRFGEVARFSLGDLGVEGSSSGPRGGMTATNVQWHPSGRFLAVNINTQNRVAFFAVTEQNGALSVRSWGNIVEVFEGHAGADADSGAGLEVFRVVRGERPALERLGRVPVPHGAHHVVVGQ